MISAGDWTRQFEGMRKASNETCAILSCMLFELFNQPVYGYELATKTKISLSTVYDNLARLDKRGFIVVSEQIVINGRNRLSYKLTPKGKAYTEFILEQQTLEEALLKTV